MSRSRAIVLALSLLLIGWGLAELFSDQATSGELRVVVENAGLPLAADQYALELRRQPGGDLVASGAPQATTLVLPAGTYSLALTVPGVYPALGAQSGALDVVAGERTDTLFRVAFGELRVSATIAAPAGNAATPDELVLVQVMHVGEHDTPLIAGAAGTALRLAAGTYDLRLVRTRATREVQTKWLEQVVIEPGRRNEQALAFGYGTLLVEATAAGRSLQPEESAITAFASGDAGLRVSETGAVARPLQLPAGTWDVEVRLPGVAGQPVRWLRGLHIEDASVLSAAVAFEVGTLTTHVSAGNEVPVPDHAAYVHVYRPDDHRAALGYARSGLPIAVPAGRYDVRVQLYRAVDRPQRWLRGVQVDDGATLEQQVRFDTGTLLVRVFDERGAEYVGDEYSIGIHPAGSRGATLAYVQAGVPVRISAGSYDLALGNSYSGHTHWLHARLEAGETTAVEYRQLRPAAP